MIAAGQVSTRFPLRIPDFYRSLIDWDNPGDPLRRQVVPCLEELTIRADESSDPLKEHDYEPVPGLIHKYAGRVLWLVTPGCPVHCRFCFRRDSLHGTRKGQHPPLPSGENNILQYIDRNPDIHEVILSGGEPFMEDPATLQRILQQVGNIKHVRLVRIHTRMPVVSPRDVPDISSFSTHHPYRIRVVLHINHAVELSAECREIIRCWSRAGIPVLSQTVLLAGVNDNIQALRCLFLDLVASEVHPYYLHLLDPAPGTSHFQVPEKRALALMAHCRDTLPGYAVPRLVRDIPGRASKTIL